MTILYCFLYYSFVVLVIYSVVVIPFLVRLTSAYMGDYPPKRIIFWTRYADLWVSFFKLLSPRFRRSLSCSMRPMTEEDRKEAG